VTVVTVVRVLSVDLATAQRRVVLVAIVVGEGAERPKPPPTTSVRLTIGVLHPKPALLLDLNKEIIGVRRLKQVLLRGLRGPNDLNKHNDRNAHNAHNNSKQDFKVQSNKVLDPWLPTTGEGPMATEDNNKLGLLLPPGLKANPASSSRPQHKGKLPNNPLLRECPTIATVLEEHWKCALTFVLHFPLVFLAHVWADAPSVAQLRNKRM